MADLNLYRRHHPSAPARPVGALMSSANARFGATDALTANASITP
jgi:hypothetical protein